MKKKLFYVLIVNIVYAVLYFGSNWIDVGYAYMLPMAAWEKTVAFSEMWIYPYLSIFFFEVVVFLLLPKNQMVWVMKVSLGLFLVNTVCFILFPTVYVRTFETDNVLYRLFLACDNARNCFPSLHVSAITFFLSTLWYYRDQQFIALIGMTVWGSLIVIATLMTKQHYLLDIAGGIVLGGIYFLSVKKLL